MTLPKVLLSYYYFQKHNLAQGLLDWFPQGATLFADSGAFSAFIKHETLPVEAYIAWLKQWSHLFEAYASLDVKGDVEAGLSNLATMEGNNLAPVPVFHAGEPIEILDQWADAYDYIALGGVAGSFVRGDSLYRWAIQCHRLIQGRAVLHGFGMTKWKWLCNLPWYSVDSTSWASSFKYGRAHIFDSRKGEWNILPLGDTDSWLLHSRTVRELGFSPLDFADRSLNHRDKMVAITARAYSDAEHWLQKRHGLITLPKRKPGLHLYLAEASTTNLKRISHAMLGRTDDGWEPYVLLPIPISR